MKAKRIIIWLVIILILGYIIMNLYNPLITVEYDISSNRISAEFEGFKIVQITDFHCKAFGDKEEKLIEEVKNANPDIIVITGDSIDKSHRIDNFRYLLEGIAPIAPIYFITGNHEHNAGDKLPELYNLLIDYNVHILNAVTEEIYRGDSKIYISGVDYLNRFYDLVYKLGPAKTDSFDILLYHGCNDFSSIAYLKYDLILAGHGHGGIVRLPFIGGVFGNDNDLFPKYSYGEYSQQESTMISSSGLGDSFIPRFNNPREIVSITLHSGE